jgi:hypothetical protein
MADRRSGWVEEQLSGLLSKQNEIVQKEAAQETANGSGTGDKVAQDDVRTISHSEAGIGGGIKTDSAGQGCM